ncbi:MAG: hypothetical protein ACOX2O_09325 [Bdellovibrionota bacterium]|jgi:hypothetical protein
MSTTIGSVITGSFINLFGKSTSKSKLSLSPLSSGDNKKDAVDFSTNLRSGASVYSRAIKTISSGAGYINLAKDTLTKLSDITDKLITLAEKATKTSGTTSLRKLNRSFQDLADEFNDLVDNADFGDREYLTIEGLEQLFTDIGLSTKNSRDLATLFDNFIIANKDSDKTLASEMMKQKKPSQIPSTAFSSTINKPYETHLAQSTTTSDPNITNSAGFISSVNTVTQRNNATDPTITEITFTSAETASENTLQYSAGTTLKTISQSSGYSVIESTDDLILGQNTSNYKQLFLIDASGTVLHQLTNMTESVSFGEVAISDTNDTIYSYANATTTSVVKSSFLTAGSDPATNIETDIESTSLSSDLSLFDNIKISADGSYLAYRSNTSGTWKTHLKDSETLTSDTTLENNSDITNFGFIANDTLALIQGVAGNQTISYYKDGSDNLKTVASALNIGHFSTVQADTSKKSFISYTSNDISSYNDLYVIDEKGNNITTYDFEASDNISNFSIASNENGLPRIGLFGTLSVNGDTDSEMYQIDISGGPKNIKYTTNVSRPLKIFSSTFSLSNRASGYVALDDLKAIKKQITENLENLDKILDVMQENVDLVRATGLAMLEVANKITSYDDAESVAKSLRLEILKTAPTLLNQVHNLEPLASAALLYED